MIDKIKMSKCLCACLKNYKQVKNNTIKNTLDILYIYREFRQNTLNSYYYTLICLFYLDNNKKNRYYLDTIQILFIRRCL